MDVAFTLCQTLAPASLEVQETELTGLHLTSILYILETSQCTLFHLHDTDDPSMVKGPCPICLDLLPGRTLLSPTQSFCENIGRAVD